MNRLAPGVERAIEQSFANNREAHELLDLVVAEFRTDPMSVQCFDLSLVERATACVDERKRLEKLIPGGRI